MSYMIPELPVVAILMPEIKDWERFSIRYQGLAQSLGLLGLTAAFARSHDSYKPDKHTFDKFFSTNREDILGVNPEDIRVIRDLTMAIDEKPLYADSVRSRLVHEPEFNRFLSRKDLVYEVLPEIHPLTFIAEPAEIEEAAAAIPGYRVILKPAKGSGGKGVRLVRKKDIGTVEVDDVQLVQEFIDTSAGDPNLDIEGTHNLRLVSVDSEVIGAVARVGGKRKSILLADGHGQVFEPEDVPDDVQAMASTIHGKFSTMPGEGKNVIAIDVMYGKSKTREPEYVVCEINRRPVRISPWDLRRSDTQDPKGMLWLAREWDTYEADMLAALVDKKTI